MSKLQLLIATVLLTEISAQETIRWVNSTTVTPPQLLPAGGEFVPISTTYVGRALHNSVYVPGKAVWREGQFFLYIAIDGVQIEKPDLEVLMAPPASISWARSDADGSIPNHPVYGGIDPGTGEITYICRAFYEGHLIVGRLMPSSKVCYVPLYYDNSVRTFEILVKNDYAIYMGIQE